MALCGTVMPSSASAIGPNDTTMSGGGELPSRLWRPSHSPGGHRSAQCPSIRIRWRASRQPQPPRPPPSHAVPLPPLPLETPRAAAVRRWQGLRSPSDRRSASSLRRRRVSKGGDCAHDVVGSVVVEDERLGSVQSELRHGERRLQTLDRIVVGLVGLEHADKGRRGPAVRLECGVEVAWPRSCEQGDGRYLQMDGREFRHHAQHRTVDYHRGVALAQPFDEVRQQLHSANAAEVEAPHLRSRVTVLG
eukprot:1774144-Prymnesium_polylepis.1